MRDSGNRSVSYITSGESQSASADHCRDKTLRTAYIDEFGKGRVAPFLLLKLVLAVQLVRAVLDEGPKMRHDVEKDVANVVDDMRLLLPLVEQLGEPDVDGVDLEGVPEDLGHEIFAPRFGDDVLRPERLDPELWAATGSARESLGQSTERRQRTSRKYSRSRTKSRSV